MDIRKDIDKRQHDRRLNNAFFYRMLHDLIENNDEDIIASKHLMPDFIFKESLSFFEDKEEYEKCHVLQDFMLSNPHRILSITRNDWMMFGWKLPNL